MTRKVVACVLALALGLCAWVPSVAIAEANVEHDTQTEVLDMVVQGESDATSGTQNTSTTKTTSASPARVSSTSSNGTKTPQTGDGTSAFVPVALAGAALAAICVGKAVRE